MSPRGPNGWRWRGWYTRRSLCTRCCQVVLIVLALVVLILSYGRVQWLVEEISEAVLGLLNLLIVEPGVSWVRIPSRSSSTHQLPFLGSVCVVSSSFHLTTSCCTYDVSFYTAVYFVRSLPDRALVRSLHYAFQEQDNNENMI